MDEDKKIIFFSGAGISAESGISTFRDTGGLWEEYKIEDICTAGCLDTNRMETIEFYNKRREDIKDKVPNKAHNRIVELQKKYPNNIKIVTQNVDDLFEKAGAKDILHLHGFLPEVRCENEQCKRVINIGYEKQDEFCPSCGEYLRPNIVFFGEQAPKYQDLYKLIEDVDIMVIMGTSGNVIDVYGLLHSTNYGILNNLEESDAIDDSVFHKVIYDKATVAIDEISMIVEEFLDE
ncbi:MAG: NAD-dependent deacetylase [Arcobacteraceae bacterium]|nr:NAD-dependent deacetylase [Arcobacteraceae bacterium]